MTQQNLYIIAGCNGAGKTTASFTILPDILNCKEFVNADEIARGLSPFNVESVAFESGRIMLNRINELLEEKRSFALETTLSTKSYVSKIKYAQKLGYTVNLLFFLLKDETMAIERVKQRVKDGGHNIPKEVIIRRYYAGITNLFNLYLPLCDEWIIFDNSLQVPTTVAEGNKKNNLVIENKETWNKLKQFYV